MDEASGPAGAVVEALRAAIADAVHEVQEFRGETTIVVTRERVLDALAFFRDGAAPRFAFLTDLTALDRFPEEPRFEVVYLLMSFYPPARIRLKARLPGDAPEMESATTLWPAADWFEREVYDFFGIRFRGHPNLTRILMPDDWEGYPLRKDFPLVEEPVEFVGRVPKPPSGIIPDVPPKGS